MPVGIRHLISNQFDSTTESASGSWDFNGVTPRRVTLYVVVSDVQGATTEDADLTVEFSPDDGQTLVTYDKIITDAGVDAPAASTTYTLDAAADDVISMSMEDVLDYIKVTVTADGGAGTLLDASNRADVDVWLVYTY